MHDLDNTVHKDIKELSNILKAEENMVKGDEQNGKLKCYDFF